MWILFLATLNAAETEGYAEIRASYVGGVEGTPWQIVERFRPTLSSEMGKKWALEATVEVIGAHGRWEPASSCSDLSYGVAGCVRGGTGRGTSVCGLSSLSSR